MTPSTAAVRHRRQGGRRVPVAVFGLLALLVGSGLALVQATPAQAHATLVSSSPEDGTEIRSPPADVDFVFDQTVRLAAGATAVIADNGHRIDQMPTTIRGGTTVQIPLKPSIANGGYTASYRVVSEDGHVVSGAIRFGVGVQPSIRVQEPAPVDPLSVVQKGAQGFVYLGIILLVGVPIISGLIWRFTERLRKGRALRIAGWTMLAAGTVIRLVLAGPLADGSGLGGAVGLSGFSLTVTSTEGIAGLVRLALLIILLPWTVRPWLGRLAGRTMSAVLAVGLLVTVALDGHAAAGSDAPLATVAATGHLAAMASWLGGLVVLVVAVLPRAGWSLASPASFRRWSVIAFTSISVLIVSGEYLAWRQLDPIDSLVHTTYGITLLIKLVLVAIAAAAGWVAHRNLVRTTEDAAQPRRLRRTVMVEAAVAMSVVIVTTSLVALPPARTTYGPPVELQAPVDGGTAVIDIDSTRTGVQQLVVHIERAGGTARTVGGSLDGRAVASVPLKFSRSADDTWTSQAVVPVAGSWTLQLAVDLGDSGQYATAASYRVW